MKLVAPISTVSRLALVQMWLLVPCERIAKLRLWRMSEACGAGAVPLFLARVAPAGSLDCGSGSRVDPTHQPSRLGAGASWMELQRSEPDIQRTNDRGISTEKPITQLATAIFNQTT